MTVVVYEADRIRLRHARADDAPFVLQLLNQPSWHANIGDRGVRTVDDARRYVDERLVSAYRTHGFGLYLVERRSDGAPLGLSGLVSRDTLPCPDLGFALLDAHAGQGYGVEAASAALCHARESLRIAYLVAIVKPANARSVRVLERLGFERLDTPYATPEGETLRIYESYVPVPDARPMRRTDKYTSYNALRASELEDRHYRIVELARANADAVIIAPHGGDIEVHTSQIARAIAGDEHSFYAFEGMKRPWHRDLHITSHNFDEPRALTLLARHDRVVAIHGCRGTDAVAFIGGLDRQLAHDIAAALAAEGIQSRTEGHQYLGVNPLNVCNRGRYGAGVQIELPIALREGAAREAVVRAVRRALVP